MRMGSQYIKWDASNSLEELQASLAQDLIGAESVQEALKKEGEDILDCYVRLAKDFERNISRVFSFHELKSAPWPFKLLDVIKHNLPQKFFNALQRSKFGWLAAEEVNAQVWPLDATVGLFYGLSNFLFCCFGALIPVEEPWLAHEVPEGALELGRKLRECYRDALFAKDHSEFLNHGAESLVVRSALANSFPSHRQEIEGVWVSSLVNSTLLFILLHEVAHVAAGHKGLVGWESRRQELDADRLAIRAFAYADARLPEDQRAYPWIGAISMSVLEIHKKLSGFSALEEVVQDGADETHPSFETRRSFLIDEAIWLMTKDGGLDNIALTGISFTFRQHVDLSSLLVRRGFQPLTAFFSSAQAQRFLGLQLRFPDHVPEVVRKVELAPLETTNPPL